MISTLGSRLVLNLRGSLLHQEGDEGQMAVKLDTLVFRSNQTASMKHSTELKSIGAAWRWDQNGRIIYLGFSDPGIRILLF